MADAGKAILGGSVSVAAIAVAMGLTTKWEGTKTEPYRTVLNGHLDKWTVCTGETRVPMRKYTLSECRAFLEKAIRSDFGRGVLQCAPAIQNSPYQLGVSIDHAYQFGVKGFCGSTMQKQFQAGDWYQACRAFEAWNKAGGQVVQGIVNRNVDRMRVCFTNLTPDKTRADRIAL